MSPRAAAVALALGLGLAGLTACADEAASPSTSSPATSSTGGPSAATSSTEPSTSAPPTTPKPEKPFGGRRVLAISVDGLNPTALSPDLTPHIWWLFERGLGTVNARSEFEKTVTLPNHVGMVTGRPVLAENGGHGVMWNSDRAGATVPSAPESIFTWVSQHGGTGITFSGKSKFTIFQRTWGAEVAPVVIEPDLDRLADAAVNDLTENARTFTFVHLAEPDHTGHAKGWLTPAYRRALAHADAVVGRLLDAVDADRRLRRSVVVVLTADHGGSGRRHGGATEPANYTIPFVIFGRGIAHEDLYAASPELSDPGRSRPDYSGVQPVRNCALANVSADILDLDPVPGAGCNADFAVASEGLN